MKFFIDTNVLISSALFPKGKTAFVFLHILENHEIVISDYVIEECKEVFKRKFKDKLYLLESFLNNIEYTKYSTPTIIDETIFPSIRDPKDLPILASAILSDSDILITGDKDFSTILIKRPLIFTPADYYELLEK